MFNGLYDFRAESARIRPFVGLGIGAALWSIDFSGKMNGIGLSTPWGSSTARNPELIGGDERRITWAWQATAGATIRLTDRAFVTAAYGFYNAPNVTWDSYNMPTLTPTLGDFSGDLKDQSISIGARWFFGAPPK
jgi:opacity protein-like surface antigen